MNQGRFNSAIIPLVAALSVFTADIAFAIDEIVVKTRKTEENLQEVPIAITTVSAEVLSRTGASGLEDITKFSPSFIFDQNSAQKDVRIAVRGLSATRGRSNVAFMVDGIDVTSEAIGTSGAGLLTSQRLLSDVQQVEAVKGPQSALYGRAAFAGAINYVTKDAPEEFEASIGGEFAQYEDYSVNGSIGAPINDQLGWLFNGYYFDNEGQYNNAISKAPLGGGDGFGGALTINWNPIDTLDIKTRLEYTDEEYDDLPRARYSENVTVTSPNPGVTAGSLGSKSEFSVTFPATFGDSSTAQFPLRRSENPRTGQEYEGTSQELFRASVVANWDPEFINGTLTSLTGYIDSDQHEEYDWDANARGRPDQIIGTHDIYNDFTIEIFSQEIRWRSEFEGPLNVTVGANYWNQERTQIEQGLLGGRGREGQNIGAPTWQEDFLNEIIPGNNIRDPRLIEDDHKSIYAMLEWDATDRVKLTLENRATWEEFSQTQSKVLTAFGGQLSIRGQDCSFTTDVQCFTQNYVDSNAGQPFFCPECAELVPQTLRLSSATKSTFNTPKLTIEFAQDEDSLYYASIAKAVKPAGEDVLGGGGRPPQSPVGFDLEDPVEFQEAEDFVVDVFLSENRFRSEKMWAYELGSKQTFTGGLGDLVFNSALFFQDYTDKQVSVRVTDPLTGLSNRSTTNAGSAEVWGVELETSWFTPIDGLIINAAYTWLDATYKEFDEITQSESTAAKLGNCIPVDNQGGTSGTIDSCLVSRAGKDLERAPEHAVALGASFTRPLPGSNLEWFVEGDSQYQSSRYSDPENTTEFDEYWKLNLRAGLEADNWEALIFVDNVFDDDTVTSGSEIPDFSNNLNGPAPNFITLGVLPPKRQAGVRVKYNF